MPALDKLIFFTLAIVICLGLAFGFGLYSGVNKNFAFEIVRKIKNDVELVFSERENLMAGDPVHFLQPSRKPGSGVTVNSRPDDGKLVLITGFFDGENGLRLMRRDGTLVAQWSVPFSKYFPDPSHMDRPPATDWNIDVNGALINPDGSVVFNFEYGGTVKLSRCGETVWTLAHMTHHSIERAEKGGYLTLGRNLFTDPGGSRFPPFTQRGPEDVYDENLILWVSEDGKIERRKSIPEFLYDNGFEPIMTATGYSFRPGGSWEKELVHANKVGELSTAMAGAFPNFKAGDLLISLRQYNLLLVVDPDTWKVKWHRTGPWRRQHDPEFNADGTITVFNNNTYRLTLGPRDRTRLDAPRVTNIIKVNPTTDQVEVVYGQKEGQEMLSAIRGKHEAIPGGGYLITEFEAGRILEVDTAGEIVWEYINRYDEDEVLEVNEGRVYPRSYFTVEDWSCPARTASQ